MCSIEDAEPFDLCIEERRTARKPHRCCECARSIQVSEKHNYVRGLSDGRWSEYRWCDHCAAAGQWMQAVCNGYPLTDLLGELRDGVMQAIVDAGVHTEVCDDDTVPDMVRTALTAIGPGRQRWAAWILASASEADDLPTEPVGDLHGEGLYEAGLRDGLRLAAEHLRSEHCARLAARIEDAA